MPSVSSFSDPKVYHILTYGTLLGSNLFQTFMNGPLAFKALTRPAFSTLQQAIFPSYFTLQSALPLLLALTWPGHTVAALGNAEGRAGAGWRGMLDTSSFLTAGIPVAIMFLTSFVNLVALGPATTRVMKERKHQETRDNKRYYEPGPQSSEMQRLNKSFGILHGFASLLNLFGTGAMIYYGATLAELL